MVLRLFFPKLVYLYLMFCTLFFSSAYSLITMHRDTQSLFMIFSYSIVWSEHKLRKQMLEQLD